MFQVPREAPHLRNNGRKHFTFPNAYSKAKCLCQTIASNPIQCNQNSSQSERLNRCTLQKVSFLERCSMENELLLRPLVQKNHHPVGEDGKSFHETTREKVRWPLLEGFLPRVPDENLPWKPWIHWVLSGSVQRSNWILSQLGMNIKKYLKPPPSVYLEPQVDLYFWRSTPQKQWSFPTKTRIVWVPGRYISIPESLRVCFYQDLSFNYTNLFSQAFLNPSSFPLHSQKTVVRFQRHRPVMVVFHPEKKSSRLGNHYKITSQKPAPTWMSGWKWSDQWLGSMG